MTILDTRLVPIRVAVLAAVGVLASALALLIAPSPHRLGADRSGEPDLAARVTDVVDGEETGYRGLSVAFVDGARVETATVGDLAGGPRFEIGSVAKPFTGMLLADLIADGVVRPDETLRDVLPEVRFDDPAVGAVTLAELASHRSGLPRLGGGPTQVFRSAWAALRGANPYGEDVDDILRQAAETSVGGGRGDVRYSNFGMALLGQALAARTGTPYTELVTERVLRPLGMNDTTLTGADSARGSTASGRPVEAWSGVGYAPAGTGVRSTAADLAKLVTALLDGSAPGADAATPRFADDESRIGYAWFTDDGITWHNGGTRGFRSYVGFDRDSGRGVVVLGNTDRDVDWIGRRLLGDGDAEPSAAGPGLWQAAVTATLLLFAIIMLPTLAFRTGRAVDRLRAVSAVLSTVVVLLVAHRLGDWIAVPPPLWAVAAGVAAAGAGLIVFRWRDIPTLASGPAWMRWSGLAASAALSLVVGVAIW
ncbi:serine hydrolase domain-containing protein [Cryptosporangium aurantiacum]|uniref:Beta-lactamase n=1 Tax=Cryptosporangium aurantiacum TaxID=134849 RepID=A0A1M7TVR8_9ACTN|nr:serine hydrolase domain-containing protein [Cryptosporangium aurantiacum]SHN74805.1 CubicO group peptidase, beta-lactamase class C family [Cryptosporangium aurantiacum]